MFFTIILTDTLDSTGEAAAETSEPQNVSTESATTQAVAILSSYVDAYQCLLSFVKLNLTKYMTVTYLAMFCLCCCLS